MEMANETVTLSDGSKIPAIGLGTWLASSPEECKAAVRAALDAAYRHIDTAAFYYNEDFIGEVLQEYLSSGKLKREELFITTKLSPFFHQKERVALSLEDSLQKLRLDYVDLFLVHTPCALKMNQEDTTKMENDDVKLEDTWEGMEQVVRDGRARSIGVSNFNKKQLERIYNMAEIQPVTNQVECHLYFQQTKLYEFMKEKGMIVTAYSPLGSPGRPARLKKDDEPNVLVDPVAKQLAEKYKKTVAQILLRFLVQRGMAVIPKSTNAGRLKENIQIFDFELTEDEMTQLAAQDKKRRIITGDIFKTHPEYSFNEEF